MKLIMRCEGNCGSIARSIADELDQIVSLGEMQAHPCAGCAYECFAGKCQYRSDGVYALYRQMMAAEQVILIEPNYGASAGTGAACIWTEDERPAA